MVQLLLLICIALPVCWLVSEFQSRRWISLLLGVAAISVVGLVAYAWAGLTTTFEKNLYFGDANAKLLKAVDLELERGNVEKVGFEVRRLAKSFHPSYENYPRYDEQVNEFVERLSEANASDAEPMTDVNNRISGDDSQVTVFGVYHSSGKFGPSIPLGDTSVYLIADGSVSWPDLEGQHVEVSGQLHLAPETRSEQNSMAKAPARLLLTTSPGSIVTKAAK